MLNVTTSDVDELVALALEHGFATFILASDDPYAIERFGQEVAPAVREGVAAARAQRGTATGPFGRSPAVRAQRMPGIDYDAAPVAAVEPGDRAYGKVRSTYMRKGSPGLVLQPANAEEVSQALIYAREQDVPLAVRSGGHGISGRSTLDGGIVIDLGKLNGISVDGNVARLGPGARWGHVAQELGQHGLGMSSGDYGDVGVGGLATAGGVGFMSRKHGLTIDHVDGRAGRARGRQHRATPTRTCCGRCAARARTSASSPSSSSRRTRSATSSSRAWPSTRATPRRC